MAISKRQRRIKTKNVRAKNMDPYIRDWVRGVGRDTSESFLFSPGSWTSAEAVWGTPSQKELEYRAQTHPVARAAVYEIGFTACKPALVIGKETPKGFIKKGSSALDLVLNPNGDIDGKSLIMCGGINLSTTGIWYIQKVRSGGNQNTSGPVEALYAWPSSWVMEEINNTNDYSLGPVLGYWVEGQGDRVPPENMIRIWYPSTQSPWAPSSPLSAAYNDIRLDCERELYQAEMLLNTPVPGVGVNLGEKPPLPKQQREFEDELINRFGHGRRGRPFIFGGMGAGLVEASSLKDMDWPGLGAVNETRICAALGVPPIIIGTRAGLDRSTYSNYGLAQRSFYEETMVPLWTLIADGLTRSLLRAEGIMDLEFRFDYESLPIFIENKDVLVDRLIKLKQAGIYSVNRVLEELGEETLGPEYDYVPKPGATILPSEESEEDTGNDEEEDEEDNEEDEENEE